MSNNAIGQKPATVNLNALKEIDRNPGKRDLAAGVVATAATIGSKSLLKSHNVAFSIGTALTVNSARNIINLIDGSETMKQQSVVGNAAQLIGGGGLAISALVGRSTASEAADWVAARPGLAVVATSGVLYNLLDRHLDATHTVRGAAKGALIGTAAAIAIETFEKGAIAAPKTTLYATIGGAAILGIAGYIQDKSEGVK